MSTPSCGRRIKQLVAELCAVEVDDIRDEGKLLGYGLDSIRVVDLLLAVEEEYRIEISEDDPDVQRVRTVGELVALVERRRGG